MSEVETEFGRTLPRISDDKLDFPDPENRFAHVGFHPQKQSGKSYVGLVLPVGRIQADQARGIAEIVIRLTVWQNLLIPDIDDKDIDAVKAKIEGLGLHWNATSFRAGLVACTGSRGCKFAAADTKGQAMILADYLEKNVDLDQPLNIHLTGCHHSCAQHYIGDIGLMGTNVEVGDDMVEGYQVVVGVHRMLDAYLEKRNGKEESFVDFAARHNDQELITFCNA